MPTPPFRQRVLGLVLLACALPPSAARAGGAEPAREAAPRLDRFGDPLPDGAVARLGTARWGCPQLWGLAVSADGKRVVTLGKDNRIRTWDVATAKLLRKAALPPEADFGLLLGPGRVLLHTPKGALSVWDIQEAKEVVKLRPGDKGRPPITCYDVTADGRSLVTVVNGGFFDFRDVVVTRYDLETGAARLGLEARWTTEGSDEHLISLALPSWGRAGVGTIAVLQRGSFGSGPQYRYRLRCKRSDADPGVAWEVQPPVADDLLWAVSYAPDDRALFAVQSSRECSRVVLLEPMTGHERCRIDLPVYHLRPGLAQLCSQYRPACVHAFSGGDLLAVDTWEATATVIDVRCSRVVATLRGGQGELGALAFGPDGTTLFAAGEDGTVLVWDLRPALRQSRQAVERSDAEVRRLWADLADPDSLKAYRALGDLVTAPDWAVALCRSELRPVAAVPGRDIDKWVAGLDDDDFETRQHATDELRRAGVQARAALERCLERSDSLEQVRRAQGLLAEVNEHEKVPAAEELRALRAVEALEAIGTPAAWSVIESLAAGAPGMRLTDEAAAALRRRDRKVEP